MKKILLISVVTASLPLSVIACEFHGGGYFSPFDWRNAGINHPAIAESHKASPDSERSQPDFRYTRAKPTAKTEDTSKEDPYNNKD